MKQKNILMLAVGVLVAFGVGFYAGIFYQKGKSPQFSRNGFIRGNGSQTNGGRSVGQQVGFRPVVGEIISLDEKSVTVKLNDGSSKIVLYGGSTAINKETEAVRDDLAVGATISAFGTENSDGSLSATSISLNPVMRLQKTPNP